MQAKQPSVNLRRLQANRANALRSTGPHTPQGKCVSAMNALQHGAYARSVNAGLERLGEDPAEFAELLKELIASHRPANPSERMLVEDIAALRWQRRRVERAQAGKQARALEALEIERRRRAVEMQATAPHTPGMVIPSLGLRVMDDSPGKFQMLVPLLEEILRAVENGNLMSEAASLAEVVYGTSAPTAQGTVILGTLRRLAMRDAALAPAGSEWQMLLRQMNSIDRNLDRRLRLLLEFQRQRKPRPQRPARTPDLRNAQPQNNPLDPGETPPSD